MGEDEGLTTNATHSWRRELEMMLDEAEGDIGLLCGLVALRKAERGGPGREFGVLAVPAPMYEDQLRVAGNSFRNALVRYTRATRSLNARDHMGFFAEPFLDSFSDRWAPIGAENDPKGLNRHHARNLKKFYQEARVALFAAVRAL